MLGITERHPRYTVIKEGHAVIVPKIRHLHSASEVFAERSGSQTVVQRCFVKRLRIWGEEWRMGVGATTRVSIAIMISGGRECVWDLGRQ